MAATHARCFFENARGMSETSTRRVAPATPAGCTSTDSTPCGRNPHSFAPARSMAPRSCKYNAAPSSPPSPPSSAAAGVPDPAPDSARARTPAPAPFTTPDAATVFESAAIIDAGDPGRTPVPVVGSRTLPLAHTTSPPPPPPSPAPSTPLLYRMAPWAFVCVRSANVPHAKSALAASSSAWENAKTCSPPATSSVPPLTPALASLSRRPMAGVTTHAAARTAPTSSVRACASLGLDDARWFTTSSEAPRNPTTRGMSSSSKPGMPRVKRKIANSSSCCAATTVGAARAPDTPRLFGPAARPRPPAGCALKSFAGVTRVNAAPVPALAAFISL
mmetsp:Transcript_12386/g.30038  ORF Transcript_12386/g.30038 Transcript_12386/m.30038 type:complete len:333 (-) Transcript_12386:45-1043(-)